MAKAMLEQRKAPQVVPPKRARNASLVKRRSTMRYEMQNFIKFASSKKVSNVGQKPKRDEHKRLRKIARKNKALARKISQ